MGNGKMTFGRWLQHQTKRKDAVGELARYAEWDIAAPNDAKSFERWTGYLHFSKVHDKFGPALYIGWKEWERGEWFPEPEMPRWCIGHLDREYAAQRGDPVLAVVEAPDQREALIVAGKLGLNALSGLWAYRERSNG